MKVRIGKSKLHGRGVIASEDIKKGERVFTIKGRKVKFLIDNQKTADAISYNLIGIGKNTWVNPDHFGQYYNHSCAPNSGIVGKNVIAVKNIKKGEEVTADYSLNEADIFWYFRCSCGAKSCRGIVRSIQFLPQRIFNQRRSFISKYFRAVFEKFKLSRFGNKRELQVAWVSFIKKGFRV